LVWVIRSTCVRAFAVSLFYLGSCQRIARSQARDAGKVTSVGVSNFGPAQIEGLKAAGCELPEVITLAECHWHIGIERERGLAHI